MKQKRSFERFVSNFLLLNITDPEILLPQKLSYALHSLVAVLKLKKAEPDTSPTSTSYTGKEIRMPIDASLACIARGPGEKAVIS